MRCFIITIKNKISQATCCVRFLGRFLGGIEVKYKNTLTGDKGLVCVKVKVEISEQILHKLDTYLFYRMFYHLITYH